MRTVGVWNTRNSQPRLLTLMKRRFFYFLLATSPLLAYSQDITSLGITLADERVSIHGLAWYHEDPFIRSIRWHCVPSGKLRPCWVI
jgi:hypothetical protein